MSPLVLLLLACGAKQAPTEEPTPPEEPTPVEAPAPPEAKAPAPLPTPAGDETEGGEDPTGHGEPIDPGVLIASWTSPSCGERTYERRLRIVKDGTWAAEDRVSPCPPDAMCVWSGVVPSQGTWKPDGGSFALVETEAVGSQARPRPTRMTPTADGALSEEADGACLYTRQ